MNTYKIPKEEIRLAAKCGFLSKRLWNDHINKRSRSRSYIRWKDYIKKEIFIPFGRHQGDEVVFLNKQSKIVQSVVRGKFVHPPIAYQILHDEIVVDTVLDWTKKRNISNYFFEAEIRKAPRAFGIRKIDKIPDAIIEIEGENFAIEVELSRKSAKRYRKALTSYAISESYREVHFYTDREEIKHCLVKAAKEIKYPNEETPMQINLISVP